MNNKIILGLIVVIIIFLTGAYVNNKNKIKNSEEKTRQELLEKENTRPEITINTKHQYKDGNHIFVGKIEVPSHCYEIKTSVIKRENETILDIKTLENKERICAQVISEKIFKVQFKGREDENIITTLNGEVVNLNIFEINLNQNIDEIEIFNKG